MRDVLPHCRNGLVVSVVRREQGVEREWRESDAEVREGCSSGCKRTQETLYAKRTALFFVCRLRSVLLNVAL